MTTTMTSVPGGRPSSGARAALARPAVWGWISFDFAAQPFFTVVITFVFGPYFVSQLAPDPATGQTWWAGAGTVSALTVAVLAPILGAIADGAGPRKPFIAAFALVKIAALCLLWTAAPGSSLLAAATLVILATIAAELSIVLNDAMIPQLVPKEAVGVVSNVAWGIGYVGGLIALFATLFFLAASPSTGLTVAGLHPLFDLDPATGEGARATGPLSALWYLVFVLPMFLLVPDRAPPSLPARGAVRRGFDEFAGTLRELRARPALARFLIARLLYQDGVNGVLLLGGAFAAGLFGWSITESGVFGIMLVLAAIVGCGFAGVLDRYCGSKAVVMVSIVSLIVATVGIISTTTTSSLFGLLDFTGMQSAGGFFARPAEKVYLLFGGLIGIAFGPVQASSRSWLAQSVAVEEAGRWFGLYALTGRVTSFLAPLSVAVVTGIAASLTGPTTASRIGMAALIVFLVAGFLVLLTTRDPRRGEWDNASLSAGSDASRS
ncbi:MFS transporter [Aureimonas mangrovi]|uniref:MFS transporter n=1 Tax=Aureimonas mangrovi TaxID=2758041 RepID=UPI001FE80738|nr:MFS transporter [Aureimonas mangrovi]